MKIVPAIIPQDFKDLREKMSLVANLAPMVQIDVLDGEFTPYKSWPYLTKNPDGDFARILNEEVGFPFWDELDFEAHLMVAKPEEKINDWIKAGASRIIIHVEATDKLEELIKNFRKDFPMKQETLVSVELGVALNIDTPVSKIENIVQDLDFVQCMSISEIGHQGALFEDKVFDKIDELHENYPELIISVDGGVNLENAQQLFRAGASRLVVGSAIFESDDITQTINELEKIDK